MDSTLRQKLSGNLCGKCGGEAPGWKCPKCGKTAKAFDPSHWRVCPEGGKMEAQCQKCGQAESNCKCA